MCTLVIAWQVLADAPVAVAANRDEALDRPSRPPFDWGGDPAIVAPRDERAGGTWIGYNDAGVFVGISNRWTDREVVGERSRGLLVVDALRQRSARAAASVVEESVASADHAGFNLLVADASAAILFEWDGRLGVTDFDPGVHVLMNAGYDGHFWTLAERPEAAEAQAASAGRVREELRTGPDETVAEWLDRAGGVLGGHDYGVCIHGGVSGQPSDGQPEASTSGDEYGTQSSSLIAIRDDGPGTFRYADGPPCVTPFEPVLVPSTEGQS